MSISLLYEDDEVVAVAKPAGQLSIPARHPDGTDLLTRLTAARAERLLVVHRLDREVSGVILFARQAEAHRRLNEQFATRQVRKTYRALVSGAVSPPTGTLDAPLRGFGSGRVGVDAQAGKASRTDYEVSAVGSGSSLLVVHPRTGRRHQIRVHLYDLGHPILGDPRYGDATTRGGAPRLMLHAAGIAWTAADGSERTVACPDAPDFSAVLAARGYRIP